MTTTISSWEKDWAAVDDRQYDAPSHLRSELRRDGPERPGGREMHKGKNTAPE